MLRGESPARERAHIRALHELHTAERVRELPERCRQLRTAEDPTTLAELVFRDLPYARVMALVLVDLDVREAVALLPAEWRWSA